MKLVKLTMFEHDLLSTFTKLVYFFIMKRFLKTGKTFSYRPTIQIDVEGDINFYYRNQVIGSNLDIFVKPKARHWNHK